MLLPVFRHLIGNILSPAGGRARLSILIYHHVLAQRDPVFPEDLDSADFELQMRTLAQCCNVLPLSEAVERLARGDLPARAACVTFDDGYENNVSVALPVLQRQSVPAAFFITSSFLHGGRMWNDTLIQSIKRTTNSSVDLSALELGVRPVTTPSERRSVIDALLGKLKYLPHSQRAERAEQVRELVQAQIPANVMMSPAQVKQLREAGMEVGGHTVTHPILAAQDPASAWREIAEGKEALEAILGERLTLFAYPNGVPQQDYQREHVQMVQRAGFSCAVSTARGAAMASSDLFQLPRFPAWGTSPAKFVSQIARGQLSRQTLFA